MLQLQAATLQTQSSYEAWLQESNSKIILYAADFSFSEEDGSTLATAGSIVKGGGRLYEWPKDLKLAAGESLQWPFFLHPRKAGQLALHCQWHYESLPASKAMPWRILRWSSTVDILPSLNLEYKLLPSSTHLHRSLLQLTASMSEVSSEFV